MADQHKGNNSPSPTRPNTSYLFILGSLNPLSKVAPIFILWLKTSQFFNKSYSPYRITITKTKHQKTK